MGRKKHKYNVKLSPEERRELNRITSRGRTQVRKYKRAQILRWADENHEGGGKTDGEIAERLGVGSATVERTRRRYVDEGLEAALHEKPRSGRGARLTGEQRAQITGLACSTPPDGYGRWTLRLLADKAVELEFVESISYQGVSNILKKTNCVLT